MRTIILFLSILLLSSAIEAQLGLQWQKKLGGSEIDRASSFQQTTDSGFIIVGFSESNNGDIDTNRGGHDLWVVKLSQSGDLSWQKSFGGSSNEEAWSVHQTFDGGYIIAGTTNSKNGDIPNNKGYYDFWILKLTNLGDLSWQKSLGGTKEEEALSVRQTIDSGYIIAGFSLSEDGDLNKNQGGADYWIVKLSQQGEIDWQRSFGGSGRDVARDIHQLSDSGYLVAGISNSNDGDVSGNHGEHDFWIVKLSHNGDLLWQKSIGGEGSEQFFLNAMQPTSDNGIIVAITSNSKDGDVSGNHGEQDYWIVKLSDEGEIIWQKSLGGSGNEEVWSVKQLVNGEYIVAGFSNSEDGDISGHKGDNDFWIVQLSESGNIIWQKSLGGSQSDNAYDILEAFDGSIVVLGTSSSSDGDLTSNNGSDDFWIVNLTSTVGLDKPAQTATLIYPNPTSKTIIFDNINEELDAILVNDKGQVIFNSVLKPNTNLELDINEATGIYFLKLKMPNGEWVTRKIIKR